MMISEGGSGGRAREQDFELNLASIIDCFVVLITYLLVCASFISLGVFDVGVVNYVASVADEKLEGTSVDVTVDLDEKRNIQIKVSGAASDSVMIPAKTEQWDFATLTVYLNALKSKWPEMNSVILSAEKNVEYSEVIRTIETIRATIPGVALGEREQS